MFHILVFIIVAAVIAVVVGGIIYRKHSGVCKCPHKLEGKNVIITGSSAGIGKEAAKELAARGARVIMACRNLEKAQKVKDWIIKETGNGNVVLRHVDVSDLDSVRKFSKEILEQEKRIDILINNAGVSLNKRMESEQGFELTFATNHLGPFLLTNLLLDLMKKSAPSRIITVSSAVHQWANLNFDDIHFKKRNYSSFQAYAQSKMCNILFTKELAHRLTGKGVTVNTMHPGFVDTEILTKTNSLLDYLIYFPAKLITKTPNLGAQTIVHLAVSEEAGRLSGEYFVDCKDEHPCKRSCDPGLAKKLWEFTEDEVGLKSEEKFC